MLDQVETATAALPDDEMLEATPTRIGRRSNGLEPYGGANRRSSPY
jgi:hypothetical protein